MPAVKESYKRSYCMQNYEDCAIFSVLNTVGKEKVPSNLFPNETLRAQDIVFKEKGRI